MGRFILIFTDSICDDANETTDDQKDDETVADFLAERQFRRLLDDELRLIGCYNTVLWIDEAHFYERYGINAGIHFRIGRVRQLLAKHGFLFHLSLISDYLFTSLCTLWIWWGEFYLLYLFFQFVYKIFFIMKKYFSTAKFFFYFIIIIFCCFCLLLLYKWRL